MPADLNLIPMERIEHAILLIRGEKVMLDRDLAGLYGVETRVLNQAVRRNLRACLKRSGGRPACRSGRQLAVRENH